MQERFNVYGSQSPFTREQEQFFDTLNPSESALRDLSIQYEVLLKNSAENSDSISVIEESLHEFAFGAINLLTWKFLSLNMYGEEGEDYIRTTKVCRLFFVRLDYDNLSFTDWMEQTVKDKNLKNILTSLEEEFRKTCP